MPSKHQPDYMYLRHVPLKKVHLFTAIQVPIFNIRVKYQREKGLNTVFPFRIDLVPTLNWVFINQPMATGILTKPSSRKQKIC